MLCENFSLTHICGSCQEKFLQPALYKRAIQKDIELISFYKYDDIKNLLHTKHAYLGYHIYALLAKLSFKVFAQEFHTKEKFASIAIDDHARNGYSHTAILNEHLKSYNIKPLYNTLRSNNPIAYSGKSKYFRENNPRNFQVKKSLKDNLILVDDIVTTGSTLNQAIDAIGQEKIAFCLSLVDTRQK